jgi:hypothetical protein
LNLEMSGRRPPAPLEELTNPTEALTSEVAQRQFKLHAACLMDTGFSYRTLRSSSATQVIQGGCQEGGNSHERSRKLPADPATLLDPGQCGRAPASAPAESVDCSRRAARRLSHRISPGVAAANRDWRAVRLEWYGVLAGKRTNRRSRDY